MALPLYERFAQVMEHLCKHDGNGGHGYTQDARWGDGTYETITLSDGSKVKVANGDRDCSSGIISALQAVGVDTKGATYTGNMRSCLLKTGLFDWYPMSVHRPAKRGDIYLNEGHHTAMCTSDKPDMLCQFSINEKGTAHGGKKGDQTGSESNFRAYYSYPWDGRLCWKDRSTPKVTKPAPKQVAGDAKNNLGLYYSAHVQSLGWAPSVHDGQTAGTTGQSKRIEAIRFDKLPAGLKLDTHYHVQGIGWMAADDVKVAQTLGTTGKSLRLEAVQVHVLALPDSLKGKKLRMQAHVQKKGWMPVVGEGDVCGTTGQGLRMEAVKIWFD